MIPVFTLERQNRFLMPLIIKAVKEVIGKGNFILGENVALFEKEFAAFLGIRYAAGVASGTDALSLALLACGVKAGDEVILPANSYPTVFAVSAIGAIPRLVDIEPATFNIDPGKIKKAVNKKTKAVIAVHLYGQPADLDRIIPVVRKHKLKLVEDCAQAHGAEVLVNGKWKKVGTIGDAGCFSFYPTKNLGCFGDGGMVVSNDGEIIRKTRLLRMYGEEARYESIIPGRNSRLDELQAAILRVKLPYLNGWIKSRRAVAEKYRRLKDTSKESSYAKHVYHLYVIRSRKRDELIDFLFKKGIGTAVHYPKPIHFQKSFADSGHKKGDFPQSERACREVLSMPMFPELTDRETHYIINSINDFNRKT